MGNNNVELYVVQFAGKASRLGALALVISITAAGGSANAFTPTAETSVQGAFFACRALRTQTCYFEVVSVATGQKTNFSLRAADTHRVADLAPGANRYVVTINHPLRNSALNCDGQFDKRFSLWCKRGVVREGENN